MNDHIWVIWMGDQIRSDREDSVGDQIESLGGLFNLHDIKILINLILFWTWPRFTNLGIYFQIGSIASNLFQDMLYR